MVRHFENTDELQYNLEIVGHEYEIVYNENAYFLCKYGGKKGKFCIEDRKNENRLEYSTFDQLLDNFKINEKSLREIILIAEVTSEW